MIIKIISATVVVICGVASLQAAKVLRAVKKSEPSENSIMGFKLLMLTIMIIFAVIGILPNYI